MTARTTVNASGGLPSGTTLGQLRVWAETYGGNQCAIDGTDLLVLLDTIDELQDARTALADELCAELELFDQADSVPGRTDWQRWMFMWEDGPGAAAFIRAYMKGETS